MSQREPWPAGHDLFQHPTQYIYECRVCGGWFTPPPSRTENVDISICQGYRIEAV